MYTAFAQVQRLNKTIFALLCGDQAHIVHRWQTEDLSEPNTLTFYEVPMVTIGGPNNHEHTYLRWVKGIVRCDKYVPRGYPGTVQSPRTCYRSTVITVPDQPIYVCRGWNRRFEPLLEIHTYFEARPYLACIPASLLLLTNMGPCPDRLLPPQPPQPPKKDDKPDDSPDDKAKVKPYLITPVKKRRATKGE